MTLSQLIAADTEDDLVDALHEAGLYDPTVLKAIFIIGLGGSGKGRVGKAMFAGRGLRYINQDRHLERIYKEAGKPLSDIGDNYGWFKKAQGLARKERSQAMATRQGLVIDSTGWDFQRIHKPVMRLRALGYDCYLILIKTSFEIAVARNKARADAGGRDVPKHDLSRTLRGLKRSVPQYRKLFGNRMVVIDNDAAFDDATWATKIAPALTREGDKLLAKPLKNKNGRKWLAKQFGSLDRTDVVVKKSADRVMGKQETRVVVPPNPFPEFMLGRVAHPSYDRRGALVE